MSPMVEPHAWAKELGRWGLGLLGCWGGVALTWAAPALGIGGFMLLSVGLYFLVKGAFGAVHQAQRWAQKAASALLMVVAALHVMAFLPVLVVGVLAALVAGRVDRLREGFGLFWDSEPPVLGE
ncbi:MAG: hypothetical protein QM765_31840 [Myxococcales bacterium]